MDFQKIAVLDSEVVALKLEAILKEREIPHIIQSHTDSALDGLLTGVQGWGHVEVTDEHKEAVLEIIADINAEDQSND